VAESEWCVGSGKRDVRAWDLHGWGVLPDDAL